MSFLSNFGLEVPFNLQENCEHMKNESSTTVKRQTVVPYLIVNGVSDLITFLEKSFDAKKLFQKMRDDGSVMHVEMQIGDSMIMMGEPIAEFGPMPVNIFLSVEDSDHSFQRALDAGGVSVMEVTDMEHAGERYGGVKDKSGNIWWVASPLK